MATRPCKIAIACHQGLVRALLRNIVSQVGGAEIACEACSSIELLEMLKDSMADLVLLDIGLLKQHGRKTITQIKNILPKIKILVIDKSRPKLSWALANCVDGCFSIEHARDQLHTAIETITCG